MTTPPSAFPDVEKLVVDVLKADPALAGATIAVNAPAASTAPRRPSWSTAAAAPGSATCTSTCR